MIRNPFEFARSCFANDKKHPSEQELAELLQQWAGMVEKAREQKRTGRYFEYRHEDLGNDPTQILPGLFGFIGLDLDPRCLRATELSYLRSDFRSRMPELSPGQIEEVPGLKPLMAELGYTIS